MLDGVNDSLEHARELAAIARHVRCKYNLIPFNPFPQSGFKRSDPERIRRTVAEVAGILARREEYFRAHAIDSIGTYRRRRADGRLPDARDAQR